MRVLKLFIVLFVCVALSSAAFASGGAASSNVDLSSDMGYVQMDMITIPIINDDGLFQQFSFSVSLEVDYDKRDEVSKFKPRLTDAYIQDLYSAIGSGHVFANNSSVVDITKIKKRLSHVTETVLGNDLKANKVLIQLIFQKPM